jgi:glucose/arabinose dehydrogenase
LLTFDQPQFNHDGGYLGFGPDNLLYISTGDGGSSDDNNAGHTGGDTTQPSGGLGNAQDRTKLLGKMLQIDPQGTNGSGGQYGIPNDNPFAGNAVGEREEIYAYGLRNPSRASFDDGPGGTNRMFIADVGQGDVEEVNILNVGENTGVNFGRRIREGTFDFDNTVSPNPPAP